MPYLPPAQPLRELRPRRTARQCTPEGRRFAALLGRDATFRFLPSICGWNDGGCWMLARALQLAYGSAQVSLHVLETPPSRAGITPQGWTPQHVLAGWTLADGRLVLADGDGLGFPDEIERDWTADYHYAATRIVPAPSAEHLIAWGLEPYAARAEALARYLRPRLPFGGPMPHPQHELALA